jgi:hypothetical protein
MVKRIVTASIAMMAMGQLHAVMITIDGHGSDLAWTLERSTVCCVDGNSVPIFAQTGLGNKSFALRVAEEAASALSPSIWDESSYYTPSFAFDRQILNTIDFPTTRELSGVVALTRRVVHVPAKESTRKSGADDETNDLRMSAFGEPESVDLSVEASSLESMTPNPKALGRSDAVANQNNQPEEIVIPVRELPFAVEGSIASEVLEDKTFPSSVNGPSWLRAQNRLHYTLQLMALSRQENGIDLIKRQRDSAEFAMFTMHRNDTTLYVVTYGVFSDKAAAQRAVTGLTGELADVKPWIRPFAAVQDALSD